MQFVQQKFRNIFTSPCWHDDRHFFLVYVFFLTNLKFMKKSYERQICKNRTQKKHRENCDRVAATVFKIINN